MIKYTALYIHKENNLAKYGWITVVTMKDLLLINNSFPLEFGVKVMDTANYLQYCLSTKV